MNEDKVNEINYLLKKSNLNLPVFRKTVATNGKNVHWLIKNMKKSNENIPERLEFLLNTFWEKD